MLELEMDMEADLGIDSIKRVEILGAIQELFPDLPQMNPEELAELRTLRQIVDYMGKQAPPQQNAVSQLVAVEEKATQNGHFLQLQQEIGSNLPDLDALTQSLLEVVSDKTGYPIEMLELGMDMEADLGIDSIKRVEILGAIQELFPDLPQVNPEELAEMRSLQQIVEYMGQKKTINC
jgi:acyl carrier protein